MTTKRDKPSNVSATLHDKPITMVIGRTGVGKTSLINHLFGDEVGKVGDVESQTKESYSYTLNDRLYLVDTRGLEEAGASEKSRLQLIDDICSASPQLIIYVIDGSRRDNLVEEISTLENVLSEVFKRIYSEPEVFIVANKVDNLEPAGYDHLPQAWPNTSNIKGKNIHKRIRQLYELFHRICKNKLISVSPSALEWYPGSKPWNLDGIVDSIDENIGEADSAIAKKFILEDDELLLLYSIENQLIENDIKESVKNIAEEKIKWQINWQKKAESELPKNLSKKLSKCWNSINGDIPKELINKSILLLELLLFEPYVVKFSVNDPDLERNCKVWEKRIRYELKQIGFSENDAENIQYKFKENLRSLVSGTSWLKIIAIAIVGAILAMFAAPVIGGWIGGLMGLYGAVAVKAGLAFLGFGAIAAGGFGIFGGTVVLMGGGALLAAGASSTYMSHYANQLSKASAILDGAKSLTIFEDAILKSNNKTLILSFSTRMKKSVAGIEKELTKTSKSVENRSKEIIQVMNKIIERMDYLRKENSVKYRREN